jgi:hypothetical protein
MRCAMHQASSKSRQRSNSGWGELDHCLAVVSLPCCHYNSGQPIIMSKETEGGRSKRGQREDQKRREIERQIEGFERRRVEESVRGIGRIVRPALSKKGKTDKGGDKRSGGGGSD